MEKIKIENRKKSTKVHLRGELTVDDAILLKEELHKIVEVAEKVELVFDANAEPHTAVIQLILALQKDYTRSGKKLSFQSAANSSVKDALTILGCAHFLN
ncbi:MAG: hypothetical protein GXO74_14455 [Calditrichaeota bacterium]|nr:hypothetical protein [Calditrichota bacterium]